jgi:hypothetical protein
MSTFNFFMPVWLSIGLVLAVPMALGLCELIFGYIPREKFFRPGPFVSITVACFVLPFPMGALFDSAFGPSEWHELSAFLGIVGGVALCLRTSWTNLQKKRGGPPGLDR